MQRKNNPPPPELPQYWIVGGLISREVKKEDPKNMYDYTKTVAVILFLFALLIFSSVLYAASKEQKIIKDGISRHSNK